MPWWRIYTLNIDDLVEKVLDDERNPREVVYCSGTKEDSWEFSDRKLTVVHLNGRLEDGPDWIVFSRSQYARRGMNHGEKAYRQFASDLAVRPVVFIGSSMSEDPVWEHVELRRAERKQRGERELRARSYLVTPELNRSREAVLRNYNIAWIKMTAETFSNWLLDRFETEKKTGKEALRQRSKRSEERQSRLEEFETCWNRSGATEGNICWVRNQLGGTLQMAKWQSGIALRSCKRDVRTCWPIEPDGASLL